jgi:hypothetical protein
VGTFSGRTTTFGCERFGLAFVSNIFVSQVLLCRTGVIVKWHRNEELESTTSVHCHRRSFADVSQDYETALSHRE